VVGEFHDSPRIIRKIQGGEQPLASTLGSVFFFGVISGQGARKE